MEEFILRKEPFFKISILENAFELKNEKNTSVTGIYEFSEINSLRLEKRINWLVSFASIITELIFSSSGGIYNERDQLKFDYRDRQMEISLKGGDLDLAVETVNKINQKIGELA